MSSQTPVLESNGCTVQIVIPVYNEGSTIEPLVTELVSGLNDAGFSLKVFFVDDGSVDQTADVLRVLAEKYQAVSYISLSRNFGKEAALMAGLLECGDRFDLLAYMDGDGQHTVADLLRLLSVAQKSSAEIICGVREDRAYQTSTQRRMAHLFYRIYNRISDQKIASGVGDFNVMRPKVVAALRSLKEYHLFFKGMVGWIGFSRELVPITVLGRTEGASRSSTAYLITVALSALFSFSSWPVRIWSTVGAFLFVISIAYLLSIIVTTSLFGKGVPGYASTVVLVLGLGGVQLLSIGLLGEYVGRIYDATKQRPRYVISERSD